VADRTVPMTEPSADLRQLASLLRQMFVALVNEGFNDREALSVIGTVVAAQIKGANDA
jgi:hypothetical protein